MSPITVDGTNECLHTEYSPFSCESLVDFLDFGLAGVSGHSKNFVGIKLGRRCLRISKQSQEKNGPDTAGHKHTPASHLLVYELTGYTNRDRG